MRHMLKITGAKARAAAHAAIDKIPDGWIVEFHEPRRSLEQNARMWSMLTDLARQLPWYGAKRSPEDWKLIMLNGLKRELRTAPSIDGDGLVQLGVSSSALTISEMRDLIELMSAFGAKHGVKFRAETEARHV